MNRLAAMKKLLLVAFIIFGFINANAIVYNTPKDVPNTKIVNNSNVSNPDNLLSQTTVNEINTLVDSIKRHNSSEIAVVVVNSIGDNNPKDFAHELFVLWGVGKKGIDNGLLILYVEDQHRIEFETGYGMESVLPDVVCKKIQMDYMVPYFKQKDRKSVV